MKKSGIVYYHYGMPLQPVSQWLISSTREEVYILRQEETLCQALGDSPPFVLHPGSYTSYHWKGLITKPEGGLSAYFWSKGGRYMKTDLGSWLSVIGKLSDHDPTRHSGRWGSWGSITWDLRLLFESTLPFSGIARRRGGVGLLPWGCCCCVAGWAPCKKCSRVNVCFDTISFSPWLVFASDEFMDLAATCSVG